MAKLVHSMVGIFPLMGIFDPTREAFPVERLTNLGVEVRMWYSGGRMNAAVVTHGLKLMGGNTRMWVGVAVIALLAFLLGCWLEQKRQEGKARS
jgi:hypothetical protein